MRTVWVIVAVCLLVLPGGRARAQDFFADATYTVHLSGETETARSMVGLGIYPKSDGIGYYFNGAATLGLVQPMYEELSLGAFGDPITDQFGQGYVANIGATYQISDIASLYGGIGFAGVTGVAEQFDPYYILAPDGVYYVPDAGNDAVGFNYNAGVLVSAGRVVLEAGYNSFFERGYLGIGFGF